MKFFASVLVTVGATIIGVSIAQLANGYLGTLVSMHTAVAGFTPIVVGVVLASYFGGYTIGAATLGAVLQRVGHIRLFAALAGIVAASVALMPVFTSAPAWIAMRLVTGIACAGLFMTAESWLNATSTSENRGKVFAFYMIATNVAFGLGQFIINLPAPGGFELYSLAAALFCLALVPVALTRSVAPAITPGPRLGVRDLRFLAPVAIAGCITSGLISSAFYSLVPAYAQSQGVSARDISVYIATAIFGGIFFQIPVGRFSDRFDRRMVAVVLACGLAVAAVLIPVLPPAIETTLVVTFIFGGFMATIYPVVVSHANDRVTHDRLVAVSGQLILLNGISSFLGPIIGTTIMGIAGMYAVFFYMAAIALAFAGFTIWRIRVLDPADQRDRAFTFITERVGMQVAHVAREEELAQSEDLEPETDVETEPARDPAADAAAEAMETASVTRAEDKETPGIVSDATADAADGLALAADPADSAEPAAPAAVPEDPR